MKLESIFLIVVSFWLSIAARAEDVKIGFVTGITGPIAATVQDLRVVTHAYVDMINAEGGVNGNRLVLVEKDDGYDPKKTNALVEEAIVKDKVIGLVNSAGTAPTIALIKSRTLNRYKIPLVGVFSGSDALRGLDAEEIFHTRSSYNDEVMKISRLASTMGLRHIAVLYQDDAFGQSILKSVTEGESKFQLDAFLKVPYKAGTKDFTEQANTIIAAKPQAIFLMGVPDSSYQFMKAYSAPQGASQIYTLSFVAPKMLASLAGESKIRGMAISQVVPNPRSTNLHFVRDFQQLVAGAYGKEIVSSPVTLEAYLNIRLLVTAIKMTGSHPTGEKVMQNLAAMHNFDVGGFTVDFSGLKRNGSNYLDIAVVGQGARLQY